MSSISIDAGLEWIENGGFPTKSVRFSRKTGCGGNHLDSLLAKGREIYCESRSACGLYRGGLGLFYKGHVVMKERKFALASGDVDELTTYQGQAYLQPSRRIQVSAVPLGGGCGTIRFLPNRICFRLFEKLFDPLLNSNPNRLASVFTFAISLRLLSFSASCTLLVSPSPPPTDDARLGASHRLSELERMGTVRIVVSLIPINALRTLE